MQEFLGRVLLPDGVWGSAGEDPRAECPQGERREYRFFERSALKPWNWHVSGSTYSHMPGDHPSAFNVFDHARTLNLFMLANPRALVLIGTGIFDSMTTVGGAELMVGTLTAPERVRHRRYEAGHMMYTDRNSAEQLAQDVKQLLHEASARNTEAN
jgi:carboxypeptidase C (cathepsin A)